AESIVEPFQNAGVTRLRKSSPLKMMLIGGKMLDETTTEEILLCKAQTIPPLSFAEAQKLVEEMGLII
ncbi:hypothetical protein STEG23_013124, partial [Scotinomys teguina]